METLRELWNGLPSLVPLLAVLAFFALLIWLASFLLGRRRSPGGSTRFAQQLSVLVLANVALVVSIIVLPVESALRGQLLSLVGLVLTAMIALASTTFVANVMAGFMLRAVRSFRMGDFVDVESQFGRVTERGLFHTEIQTEDRDLVTLPNLWLVTRPVRVVHKDGTIVSARFTLGYDLPRERIEKLLVEATADAGLTDGFVEVRDLGDHGVTYRAAGFLTEVKQLVSMRSRLRKAVLSRLHDAGFEIATPVLMDQRQLGDEHRYVPKVRTLVRESDTEAPEDLIFDKAEAASRVEDLRTAHEEAARALTALEERIKAEPTDEALTAELEVARAAVERAAAALEEVAED